MKKKTSKKTTKRAKKEEEELTEEPIEQTEWPESDDDEDYDSIPDNFFGRVQYWSYRWSPWIHMILLIVMVVLIADVASNHYGEVNRNSVLWYFIQNASKKYDPDNELFAQSNNENLKKDYDYIAMQLNRDAGENGYDGFKTELNHASMVARFAIDNKFFDEDKIRRYEHVAFLLVSDLILREIFNNRLKEKGYELKGLEYEVAFQSFKVNYLKYLQVSTKQKK